MDKKQPLDLYAFYRNWFSDKVSDEAVAWVAAHSRVVTKKKGEVIFAPGMDAPGFNLLLEGIMKTYISNPDGTENTFAIYFQPGMSISMSKEMVEIPGMHMKALENCKLIQMYDKDPFELAEIYPDLWREIALAFQQFYFGMMDKLRAGYLLTGKERYLWFLNKYPYVADRISQVEVANFLGIAPQSLSRIRADLEMEKENTNEN